MQQKFYSLPYTPNTVGPNRVSISDSRTSNTSITRYHSAFHTLILTFWFKFELTCRSSSGNAISLSDGVILQQEQANKNSNLKSQSCTSLTKLQRPSSKYEHILDVIFVYQSTAMWAGLFGEIWIISNFFCILTLQVTDSKKRPASEFSPEKQSKGWKCKSTITVRRTHD